jgi:hypothetical protein
LLPETVVVQTQRWQKRLSNMVFPFWSYVIRFPESCMLFWVCHIYISWIGDWTLPISMLVMGLCPQGKDDLDGICPQDKSCFASCFIFLLLLLLLLLSGYAVFFIHL